MEKKLYQALEKALKRDCIIISKRIIIYSAGEVK